MSDLAYPHPCKLYPTTHLIRKCLTGGDVVRFAQLFWNLPNALESAKALLTAESILQIDRAPEQRRFWVPKWPKRDLEAINVIVREGLDLATL